MSGLGNTIEPLNFREALAHYASGITVISSHVDGEPMRLDVIHAMRPQFALRVDIGEIAGDLVKEFHKASALRTWGWMCTVDGEPQTVPPRSLF